MPNGQVRGLAISAAIIGGTVAALAIGARFLFGRSLFGEGGILDAATRTTTGIFTAVIPQSLLAGKGLAEILHEADTLERQAELDASISRGEQALAPIPVADRGALEIILANRITQLVNRQTKNEADARLGLAPQPFDTWAGNLLEAVAVRGFTLASFTQPGSIQAQQELDAFARTLNTDQLRVILGQDTLEGAVIARALALPAVN